MDGRVRPRPVQPNVERGPIARRALWRAIEEDWLNYRILTERYHGKRGRDL
jgi:hypothetical protein